MGIASLILGIISLVIGWIPFVCFIALILAVVGLILGIVDTVKKNKAGISMNKTVTSIVGLIVSAIAIPVIIFSSIFSILIFIELVSDDSVNYEYNNRDFDFWDEYNFEDWNNRYYNSISYEKI